MQTEKKKPFHSTLINYWPSEWEIVYIVIYDHASVSAYVVYRREVSVYAVI